MKKQISPLVLAPVIVLVMLALSLMSGTPASAKRNDTLYGTNAVISTALTVPTVTATTVNATTLNATTYAATAIGASRVVASQYVALTSATAIVALSTGSAVPITSGYVVVASSGGAVTLESNPQIAAGVAGQLLIIQGSSDTNIPTLADGNGLSLTAAMALGVGDTITLIYSPAIAGGGAWVEIARANN